MTTALDNLDSITEPCVDQWPLIDIKPINIEPIEDIDQPNLYPRDVWTIDSSQESLHDDVWTVDSSQERVLHSPIIDVTSNSPDRGMSPLYDDNKFSEYSCNPNQSESVPSGQWGKIALDDKLSTDYHEMMELNVNGVVKKFLLPKKLKNVPSLSNKSDTNQISMTCMSEPSSSVPLERVGVNEPCANTRVDVNKPSVGSLRLERVDVNKLCLGNLRLERVDVKEPCARNLQITNVCSVPKASSSQPKQFPKSNANITFRHEQNPANTYEVSTGAPMRKKTKSTNKNKASLSGAPVKKQTRGVKQPGRLKKVSSKKTHSPVGTANFSSPFANKHLQSQIGSRKHQIRNLNTPSSRSRNQKSDTLFSDYCRNILVSRETHDSNILLAKFEKKHGVAFKKCTVVLERIDLIEKDSHRKRKNSELRQLKHNSSEVIISIRLPQDLPELNATTAAPPAKKTKYAQGQFIQPETRHQIQVPGAVTPDGDRRQEFPTSKIALLPEKNIFREHFPADKLLGKKFSCPFPEGKYLLVETPSQTFLAPMPKSQPSTTNVLGEQIKLSSTTSSNFMTERKNVFKGDHTQFQQTVSVAQNQPTSEQKIIESISPVPFLSGGLPQSKAISGMSVITISKALSNEHGSHASRELSGASSKPPQGIYRMPTKPGTGSTRLVSSVAQKPKFFSNMNISSQVPATGVANTVSPWLPCYLYGKQMVTPHTSAITPKRATVKEVGKGFQTTISNQAIVPIERGAVATVGAVAKTTAQVTTLRHFEMKPKPSGDRRELFQSAQKNNGNSEVQAMKILKAVPVIQTSKGHFFIPMDASGKTYNCSPEFVIGTQATQAVSLAKNFVNTSTGMSLAHNSLARSTKCVIIATQSTASYTQNGRACSQMFPKYTISSNTGTKVSKGVLQSGGKPVIGQIRSLGPNSSQAGQLAATNSNCSSRRLHSKEQPVRQAPFNFYSMSSSDRIKWLRANLKASPGATDQPMVDDDTASAINVSPVTANTDSEEMLSSDANSSEDRIVTMRNKLKMYDGAGSEDKITQLRNKLKTLQQSQKGIGALKAAVRKSKKVLKTIDKH